MKQLDKALLLENGFEIDIPEELIEYLEKQEIQWEWYDTRFSFWPENRERTVRFFSSLPKGKMLVCSTVFDGWKQLELFISLLYSLKEKEFTFKIMHGMLCHDLYKWYHNYESSICPDTEEYNDSPSKREAFKKDMNKKFKEVLRRHKIIWVRRIGLEVALTDLAVIKKGGK